MKITAVTLCLGQSDFLFQTAARNREELDELWVLTDEKDKKTVEVCETFGLKKYFIRNPYKSGIISAGVAINEWLATFEDPDLDLDRILFIDADIWLPPGYRREMDISNPEALAWTGRRMITNPTQWRDFKAGGMAAIDKEVREEWDPGIGFFQLFHATMLPKLSANPHNFQVFPEHMVTGRPGADREFAAKFRTWVKIPTPVYHLGTPGKLNRGRDHPGWAKSHW
jgi:glycosyltransferase involved in cell wall biosynthesis